MNGSTGTAHRLHWVDFAKAAAITLVVVYHVSGAGMSHLFPNPEGPGSPFWAEFNATFLPMRMPLFFVTAGMLAHAAISRPWRVVAGPRIITLLWPYLLWSVVFAAFAGFAYRPADPAGYAKDRLIDIPFVGSPYWFLAMLVVFFVTAKLLRRCAPLTLVVTLVLAVGAPFLEPNMPNWVPGEAIYGLVRFVRYSFWYFLGCYAFDTINRVSKLNPAYLIIGGAASFAALTLFGNGSGLSAQLGFVLSATGLIAAVGFSVWIVRFERVRALSRYISARTLPIYIIHPVMINVVVLATLHSGVVLGPNEFWATLLAPVFSAICMAVSIVVYDRVRKTRASWLFTPPARFVPTK